MTDTRDLITELNTLTLSTKQRLSKIESADLYALEYWSYKDRLKEALTLFTEHLNTSELLCEKYSSKKDQFTQ